MKRLSQIRHLYHHNMTCNRVFMYAMLVLQLLAIIYPAESANILCTAVQQLSHVEEVLGATEGLTKYGHTVYHAVSSNFPNPDRFKSIGIQPLTYHMPPDVHIFPSEEVNKETLDRIFNGKGEINLLTPNLAMRDCNYMMNDTIFLKKIKSLKIDFVVADGFIFVPCTLIIAKYLNVPFVSVSSTFVPFLARINDPAEVSIAENHSHQPTLLQRLKNTIMTFALFNFAIFPEFGDISLLKQYAPEIHDWHTLHREALLFITTRDYTLEWPSVITPNVIRLPGLSYKPAKNLTTEFENIMKSAHNGVIVMSFGSMGAVLPRNILDKFLGAFSKLDYTVIMRCIPPNDIHIPKNVKMFKWLPQNDLLGHQNTKLFITHCGNGGQYESVYHGVPMVGFPMFAEQYHNALRMVHKNIGIRLDIHTFAPGDLVNAVKEITTNPAYGENVELLSKILHDLPMDSKNRSAYWIDHVIKYGGKHLRSQSMDLSWYEFHMLDVLAVLVIFLLILIIAVVKLLKCFYSCVSKKSKNGQERGKKIQ